MGDQLRSVVDVIIVHYLKTPNECDLCLRLLFATETLWVVHVIIRNADNNSHALRYPS